MFPDATTTGPAAGGYTTLTACEPVTLAASGPYPSWVTVNADGSLLIEGCSFAGSALALNASNVTIRGCEFATHADGRCIILNGTGYGISYCQLSGPDATGADRADTLIACFNPTAPDAAVTIDHCDLSWCMHGIGGGCNGQVITANYIHDLTEISTAVDHCDCIYTNGPHSRIVIAGNTLLNPLVQTSAIFMDSIGGPYSDVLIEGNLVAGGDYAMYLGKTGSAGVVVTGNEFSTQFFPQGGYYGSATNAPAWGSDGNVWQGNCWYDGPSAGQPVAAPG